ncbi:hypothetical protein KDK_82040 [Dictyobacter kobayashii]|uniref:HTH lacI-type domain-containing protein n=1 Tax=Dictyobacter kobayashii TaxID=2014872 RepID=A0A402AZ61_9CHLR|nr:hypothetical protein KDK_82040 [Dictyobacter kobayashii]
MGEESTDTGLRSVPTSVDVARRAGVSQAAVSLVMGGKAAGRVGKKNQEAILRAARELGYAPNSAARTLRSGRSHVIALVVPDVNNPFFAAVFEGAERAARKEGYSVILITLKDIQDWQQIINDAFTTYAVEGWVLYTLRVPTAPLQELLRDKAIMVDGFSAEMPSLLLDIQQGMADMMQHLIQLGHTRIAHLAAAPTTKRFGSATRSIERCYYSTIFHIGMITMSGQSLHWKHPIRPPTSCSRCRMRLQPSFVIVTCWRQESIKRPMHCTSAFQTISP